MNEVAADLSRWRWLTLRFSMRRYRYHEHIPGLCVRITGPRISLINWDENGGEWCQCLSREERVWASVY